MAIQITKRKIIRINDYIKFSVIINSNHVEEFFLYY